MRSASACGAQIVFDHYNSVYFSTFGVVEIGIPGASGFSIRFTNRTAVLAYLPPPGSPSVLNADHVNPGATAAGTYGGEVLALQFNVDFADAGFTLGTSGLRFGDLRLCGMTTFTALNNLTVRQVLAIANTLLGGGSGPFTAAQISPFIGQLNWAFFGGDVSVFAQDHVVAGACA